MNRNLLFSTLFVVALLVTTAEAQVTLLSENFDSLPLMTSVDEPDDGGAKIDKAWNQGPPSGWAIDNQGDWTNLITEVDGVRQSDGNGTTEWEGWSFADPEFWNSVAGQNRDQFTNASGVIAIADGDEWDDIGDPAPGVLMDTTLSSPTVDVSGFSEVTLAFDSSWRDEEPQEGTVSVVLDGGAPVELLHYTGGVTGDRLNERLEFTVETGGASSMVVNWRYFNADNDWWWALDNIEVSAIPEPGSLSLVLMGLLGALAFRRRRR